MQELADNKTNDAIPSKELGVIFKKTKQTILEEDNKILFDADGKAIKVPQAQAILHSSSSRFEQKQQAVKCLLHDQLPGAELTEDFLMKVHTEHNGLYLKQCELSWLLQYPDLAKNLERAIYAHQIQQPHVLYSQTPKSAQKIQLLLPILTHINNLATGREYMAGDEAVIAIQQYALKYSKKFFNLFSLNIKDESVLGKGNGAGSTQNSPIATANKIVKVFGYEAESLRRVGKAGAQERVYAIGNFDCPHRQKVYKAFARKHRAYVSSELMLEDIALVFNSIPNIKSEAMEILELVELEPRSQRELDNIQAVADVLAEIVTLSVAEAIEALDHFRSVWTAEFLHLASKNLTFAQRIILKKLVVEMNVT